MVDQRRNLGEVDGFFSGNALKAFCGLTLSTCLVAERFVRQTRRWTKIANRLAGTYACDKSTTFYFYLGVP